MSGESTLESACRDGDIAIIGMACLFPGAPDVRAYWENIVGKVSAIGDPPPGWDHGGFFDPDSSEAQAFYCRRGGFLRDLACFDPMAYGVMPQSVDGAEPEHFLALRIAYEALTDAGYLDRPFNRDKAGVILGRGTFVNRGNVAALQHKLVIDQTLRLLKQLHPEYSDEKLLTIRRELKAGLPPFNAETAPGLVPNVMCGRIANRLDLKGPNFAIDAACASSLIAVDLAARELRSHRCDLVLAGGVSVGAPPMMLMGFCEVGALSRTQTIRPFDADADGTLLGEGVGIVVLKRLDDAERDGDRIYAVIKGVGIASDGRALGVLAPRLEGEELALRRAYEAAGLSPRTIELVEAHGTGTIIGDLTEVQALRRVFGDREGAHPRCGLGTVKSMISHTIPAAGVAALIKTALALYHKTLPPTLNCEKPNPKFELEKSPFYINTETRPWIHGAREPRRAGINAFGFGGINAHVILEESPQVDQATPSYQGTWESEVVILHGPSRAEVIRQGERLQQYLGANPSVRLRDIAYTLNTELRDLELRLAIVATSSVELAQKLSYALQCLSDAKRTQIKDLSGIYFFEQPLAREGKLAFLFPGEGPQYANMLADLCLHFPEVRASFDQADRVFLDNNREYVPSQIVFPPPLEAKGDESPLWQIDVAVASVFAANCGLAALFSHLGITPNAVVGHSSGEYAALLVAGAVVVNGEEDLLTHSLELNARYASFEDRIPAAVLVAVGAIRPSSVKEVLEECQGPLYITMDNCPHQVVLCGTEESVGPAIEGLRSRGAICSVLPFRRGYHTPLFKPVSEELENFYQGIRFVAPNTTLYSCATARPYPAEPDEIRKLVVAQWSSGVRFRETIEAMYEEGIRIFVEVGPGGNLSGFVDDILRKKPFLSVPVNVAHRSGLTQLNHAVGLLAAHGVAMRLDHLYARREPRRLSLERHEAEIPTKRPMMRLALELPTLQIANMQPIKGTVVGSETSFSAPKIPPKTTDSRDLLEPPPIAAEPQASTPGSSPLEALAALEPSPAMSRAGLDMSGDTRASLMAEYLRTMERFLDVQQEVVQAFLNGTASNAPLGQPWPPESKPSQGTSRVQSVPHLEAIPADSPVAEEPLPAIERQEPSAVADVPKDLATLLLALVSEKTGYPVDMLDPSLNMEADLGIDSIKRVEILGAFQRDTGLLRPEDMEQATGLKTLQQVIEFFTQRSDRQPISAPSHLASAVTGELSTASTAPQTSEPTPALRLPQAPFVREILSLTIGEEAVVACILDTQVDRFLQDHTALGRRLSPTDASLPGLSVVPLAVSLEMMAEVAALILPDRQLIGMRNVRAPQWFALDNDRRSVMILAQCKRAELQDVVEVRVVDTDEQSPGSEANRALVEGTMVFGDGYPTPPSFTPLVLRDEQPYRYSPDEYYTDVMFHGPLFQGVVAIERYGEDGVQGIVSSGVETGFFPLTPPSDYQLDPVLLDAAGQLVGFWTAGRFDRGFAFPTGFASLHLYGPLLKVSSPIVCQARIRGANDGRVRADIDCVDAAGQIVAQLFGWEDMWFDFPQEFTRFNLSRRQGMLSEPWPEAIEGLSQNGRLQCCRFRRSTLPESLFDVSNQIWQHVLARLILNRQEYEQWRVLLAPDKRRLEWLLGRLAGKDAVRLFLSTHHGSQLSPAEIEILSDDHGAPIVHGPWLEAGGPTLSLTLAHTDGVAVALAAECGPDEGIGIDVEMMQDLSEDLILAAFSAAERKLLGEMEPSVAREWGIRLWCAKEAVGKALGVGLIGGPLNVVIRELNTDTGSVSMTLTGQLAREVLLTADTTLVVQTCRDGDLVVASTLMQKAQAHHP